MLGIEGSVAGSRGQGASGPITLGLPFVEVRHTRHAVVVSGGGLPADPSANDHIFTLDEAAGVLARPDVFEDDVMRYCSKEQNASPDEYWNSSNDEALNQPSLKKSLNSDPAVNVNVSEAASLKLSHDFGGSPRLMLDNSPGRHEGEGVGMSTKTGFLP